MYSLRDELDKIARRLGGKRMSASGIVENMVKRHLIMYGDELKEWYKLREFGISFMQLIWFCQ